MKTSRVAWTPERVDETFDQMKEDLGRTPTQTEFTKKYGGAISSITHGGYHHDVRTWGNYLDYRGAEKNLEFWSPEKIDSIFDKLKEKLGRNPTIGELRGESWGAAASVQRGRYNPAVNSWNDYLKYRNLELKNEPGKWTPEKIDKEFDDLSEELGRPPTFREFSKESGGAISSIVSGRYHSDIKTWSGYKRHRGAKTVERWTPERIDQVFDEQTRNLGRAPKRKEFFEKHSGAICAINSGDYSSNIRTWNDYLRHRGFDVKPGRIKRGNWTSEAVDRAFDELKKELGRSPKQTEFSDRYSGAIAAIEKGRYKSGIKSWNQYLKGRGLETLMDIGKWTSEAVDKVFDEQREELGRTPKRVEFNKKHSGAVSAIDGGKYNVSVKNYDDYLIHRGLFSGKIKSPRQLSQILITESRAQYALKLVGGDEIDLADILVVVYEGRLTRNDVLQFVETPTLKKYLSDFKKPSEVQDVIEAGQNLLPLDKNDVIRGIIFRRLRNLRREALGPEPTQEDQQRFLEELNKQMEELAA